MREKIGPYRIERVLGEGAMGIVYLGDHEVLGRPAAIKTVLPTRADDAHLRQRFVAEARAQARLLHPNVVALYEPIDDNGELFIAMEYVEGETLAERLQRSPGGRMALDKALGLFEQLLDALEFVHSETIVHRDVKPSNVMVSSSDRVKLTDFGLALLAGEPRLTASLRIAGTPQYMSPEQLQGKDLDRRTDIYSAALVLYRMLSGRAAFESKEYLAQIHERMTGPPDLKTLVPELPASVCEALGVAMQFEPERRFKSAAEFRDELRRAVAGFFPVPPPSPDDEPTVPAVAVPEALPTPPAREPHNLSKAAAWVVVAGSVTAAASLLVTNFSQPSPGAVPKTTKAQTITHPDSKPAAPPVTESQPAKPQPKPPPKTAPDLEPPTQDDSAALAAAERRREIEALREEIRSGLTSAAADLAIENFSAAIESLERLDRKAQGEPVELWPERDEIAHLRGRVVEAEAASRMRKQQDEMWRTRLDDIENDIRKGRFPEAMSIAENVKNDPRTPPAVAARADELLREAKTKLAEVFQNDTRVGPTTNTIRKPSSPPRKND